ncbi:unnamed protein product [marine sediment metagenome]|uniref:DNA methylase N-4/N-6 domain-containing protein n=1 Tax=marine sediment metagenome TaxID=412755 RepID=X1N600_9ZZZZ
MMNKNFEIEVCGMGGNNTGYPGGFPGRVQKIIQETIHGRILNLFSGVSKIGEVRIDLLRSEATKNCDVFDFISTDRRIWDFVIADPPYALKSNPEKLKIYGSVKPFTGNIPFERKMSEYLKKYAKNVLWLDLNAPLPPGFKRKKVWLLLPGGWHFVRVLSWLENLEKNQL